MQAFFLPHVLVGATNVIGSRYEPRRVLGEIQARDNAVRRAPADLRHALSSGLRGVRCLLAPDDYNGRCKPAYRNNPVESAGRLRQGWLYTRDLFSRDSEGYHYFHGRADDMIVSGGENIYPAEVEEVLRRCPGVGEAVVVGLPDPEWGAVVTALSCGPSPR